MQILHGSRTLQRQPEPSLISFIGKEPVVSVGSELSPSQNRTSTYRARMPSDKSTVATKADFVPTVVGGTDRERSIASSAPRAHDGTSPQPRPEVHQTQFNVLGDTTKSIQ